MKLRVVVLLVAVVLPGLVLAGISLYYLLPEWIALEASYQYYNRVANSPLSTMSDLFVAEATQNVHRINCFAEGVGVLMGVAIAAIGIHGICTLPQRRS